MFNHLLSLLIWLPIAGAVPVLLAGSSRPNTARWLALLMAVLTFAVSSLSHPAVQRGYGRYAAGRKPSVDRCA